MFDIFNKKKLRIYRLLTDPQSKLINNLITDLEKQTKERKKFETISSNQADIIRKNVSKRAELNNEISVLQIDLEEANKKIDSLTQALENNTNKSYEQIAELCNENRRLKEKLKKLDEEHYCVTFCKRNSAVDEVSNAAKCSD